MIEQPDPVRIDFNLLDRQIVDRDGTLVGKVDDVELSADLRIVALLVGQRVLGERLGGVTGRWLAAVARRLSPTPDTPPLRIPYDLVATVSSDVVLSVRAEVLTDPPLEAWLREHLIDRIPGASHAEE
jgi:sporulation protein YlmC with PRC-barrel domain